jgi:hypothetical protein
MTRPSKGTYQTSTLASDHVGYDLTRGVCVVGDLDECLDKQLGICIENQMLPSILIKFDLVEVKDVEHLEALYHGR